MGQETCRMPPDGWVCFHCGERSRRLAALRSISVAGPADTPGCMIKLAGEERGLLLEVRRLEAALRELIDNARRVCRPTSGVSSGVGAGVGLGVGAAATVGDGSGVGDGGAGVGVGVAVGCGATAAVGFGGLRGFCSPLQHGGWDCSSRGWSGSRCRRGLRRGPLWHPPEMNAARVRAVNTIRARIRQTGTLPVFGPANGRRHQHYTMKHLAHQT